MELAIFIDCRKLVEKFIRNDDASFSAFCNAWKHLTFQYIYSAQSTTVEVLQTTAVAFYVAKRLARGLEARYDRQTTNTAEQHSDLLRRIGGLYLMYALYFKQPMEEYVKIELTLEAWRDLNELITTLPVAMPAHDEVAYVYWKLIKSGAFRFTALDYCIGLERLVEYDKVEEEQSLEQANSDENAKKLKQELRMLEGTQALMPALTLLEDSYNKLKTQLSSGNAQVNAQSLPPTTMFSRINNMFRRIDEILIQPGKRTTAENEDILSDSKKRSLKRKSFKSTNCVTETQAQNSNAEVQNTHSKTKSNNPRRSARNRFTEALPKPTSDDLEDRKSTTNSDLENDEISKNENQNTSNDETVPVNKREICDSFIEQILNETADD